jgi:RimJ/RimL family protein N-acetyltransferase
MRLDALTLAQCELVRQWRNQCPETLRTPYPLTPENQRIFYHEVVSNRNNPLRYWAILDREEVKGECHEGFIERFVGMGGLTNIQWENRIAEISLILDPQYRGKGLGEKAVDLLLAEGFNRMGLKTICGECYLTHEGWNFWAEMIDKYNGCATELPNRKLWAGKFWNSMYFSVDVDDWRKVKNGQDS